MVRSTTHMRKPLIAAASTLLALLGSLTSRPPSPIRCWLPPTGRCLRVQRRRRRRRRHPFRRPALATRKGGPSEVPQLLLPQTPPARPPASLPLARLTRTPLPSLVLTLWPMRMLSIAEIRVTSAGEWVLLIDTVVDAHNRRISQICPLRRRRRRHAPAPATRGQSWEVAPLSAPARCRSLRRRAPTSATYRRSATATTSQRGQPAPMCS